MIIIIWMMMFNISNNCAILYERIKSDSVLMSLSFCVLNSAETGTFILVSYLRKSVAF